MSITDAIAYLKATEPPIETEDTMIVSEDEFPAHTDYGNGLSCFYLMDKGDHFEYVLTSDLLKNAETVTSLDHKARSNLAVMAAEQLEVRRHGNIFIATMGGDFEASLLLLSHLWDETLAHTIQGDYVASIPARDVLSYCDSESEAGIKELRNIIDRVWPGGDHLISRNLYRRQNRRWVIYDA
jgi:uncharacterized protein YtpQ (UPF0354 family)